MAAAVDALQARIERANRELWARFIDRRYHVFYDYAGLDAEVHLPDGDELRHGKPNAYGWGLPNENGAFFGGIYLAGLASRWPHRPGDAALQEARAIADGLLRLRACSTVPGFVARGLATDGVSHPICGSDDQTWPWVYGLWRYLGTSMPDEAQRERVRSAVVEVITVCRNEGWRMPCDPAGFGHRGEWTRHTPVDVPRLLLACRIAHQLSGDDGWLQTYRALRDERGGARSLTRLEIAAEGFSYRPVGEPSSYPFTPPFWTSASSVAGMVALAELDEDDDARAAFRRGAQRSAALAAPHIGRWHGLDLDAPLTFDVDWRWLNETWRPHHNVAETTPLADEQVRAWHRHSPRDGHEDEHIREPLWAAWIVAMAGDDATFEASRHEIRAALTAWEPAKLYTSLFLVATNVYYDGVARGL